MGFFCLFSGNQSGINLESEWIEHAAKKKSVKPSFFTVLDYKG